MNKAVEFSVCVCTHLRSVWEMNLAVEHTHTHTAITCAYICSGSLFPRSSTPPGTPPGFDLAVCKTEGEGLGNLHTRSAAWLTSRILDAMVYIHSYTEKIEKPNKDEVGPTCKTYPGSKQIH